MVEITPGAVTAVIPCWRFQLLLALSNKGLSALDSSTPLSSLELPPQLSSARDRNKGVTLIGAFPGEERFVYSLFPSLTYDVGSLCVLFLVAYVP